MLFFKATCFIPSKIIIIQVTEYPVCGKRLCFEHSALPCPRVQEVKLSEKLLQNKSRSFCIPITPAEVGRDISVTNVASRQNLFFEQPLKIVFEKTSKYM